MRIKRIWVKKFRNLNHFEVRFDGKHHTTVLLGKNGTGKSNLLEVIALIFKDIYVAKNERQLQPAYKLEKGKEDEAISYELEYQCYQNEVKIVVGPEAVEISIKNVLEKHFNPAKLKELKRRNDKSKLFIYLPQFIVGYYSGVTNRLQEIFAEIERVELKRLKRDLGHSDFFRSMFFSQNYHSQILLLTLHLLGSRSKVSEQIIKRYLKLELSDHFSIVLKSPDWNLKSGEPKSIEEGLNSFWGAKGNAHKFLNYLESIKEDSLLQTSQTSPERIEQEKYTMLFSTRKLAMDALTFFGSAIEIFRGFENIFLADFIERIDFEIKAGKSRETIHISKISEGEQQLLAVLALLIITDGYEALYLLDEPDTHLNPAWQRDYVKLLRKSDHHKRNSQVIISTHSPLILQAAEKAEIILFNFARNGAIKTNKEAHRIKNWRIDQVLASDYFNLESTRPPSLDAFMRKRDKILSKPKLTNADIEVLKKLQEGNGILPTGETLEDALALQEVKSIAENFRKHGSNKKK